MANRTLWRRGHRRTAPIRPTAVAPVACCLFLAAATACGAATEPAIETPAEWTGDINTEGRVTTVTNTSGGVWGGAGRLVEEASIGVLEGADEYMFGAVNVVWATEDRILVADTQVPAVRVYDWMGTHLFDVGRPGEGPGEYSEPVGVAVAPNGDIWVAEMNMSIHRYDDSGAVLATHASSTGWSVHTDNMFIMALDGVPYMLDFGVQEATQRGLPPIGRAPVEAGGGLGEIRLPPQTDFEPECLEYTHASTGEADVWCAVPFAPWEVTTFTPAAEWVVGAGTEYAFEVHRDDGSRLRVERWWDPVMLDPEEIDYERQRTRAYLRNADPGWTWDGPQIPAHKPAFERIFAGRSGRLWVERSLASGRVDGPCTETFPEPEMAYGYTSCWTADVAVDGFGADGRYLGELRLPRGFRSPEPFVRDDTWIAAVMDDDGTIRVKRYRLVTAIDD